MTKSSCQVGSVNGALWRSGVFWACALASGIAAICAAPARSAGWDDTVPSAGLRMPDSLLSLKDMYPDLFVPRAGGDFTREFQPRSQIAAAASPDPGFHGAGAFERSGDLPLTNAWQRMSDFRTQDGIRLLTVWQSANSTLALHQGKHGGASLQWTSHAMNRGGASRGLFDHLVSTVRDVRGPVRMGTAVLASPVSARFSSP